MSTFFDDLLHDIRFSLRSFARHRAFAATALIAIALGIGATTAIFNVVSGVILRPLPFRDPGQLVQLYGMPAERGQAIAAADAEAFRAGTSFKVLAGYAAGARYLQGADSLERVMTVDVERGFFSLLGIQPIVGRTFGPDDPSNVAVAGGAFWRRQFGGDSAAIGRTITVDGIPRTIIGVMPDSFQFPYGAASLLPNVANQGRTDLWILRETDPGQPRRGRLPVTGRLKSGVTLAAAQSELNVILKRLETESAERPRGLGVRLVPLADAVVSPAVRRSIYILFGAAGLVLMLVCANVTNLWLVRMTMRSREVAARVAVGATPSRLVRQLLTESLLITCTGGTAGLALAWWFTRRLMQFAATRIPRAYEAGMDWRVFLFSFTLCLLTGALFALAPALRTFRNDPLKSLNEATGHSTMNPGQRRLRDALVIAEVALAFVLSVGATLLLRELVRLRDTEMGMNPENVLALHIGQQMTLGMSGQQYYDIAQRVRQVPGVHNAGFTQMLPLQSWGWFANSLDFRVRGRPADTAPIFTMELRYITPGYFQTMGIPIIRGRSFTDADIKDAPPVIVINETLARMRFGNEDPLGKETTRGTIVGIVGDVRQVNLDRPSSPEVYYPIAQNWSQLGELGMSLVVRSEGPPKELADRIRNAIREINPNLAIFSITTMDRVVQESMSDFILYLALMTAFAALALFLASTGAYGVISYIASSRTREFAIRTALGAGQAQVTRLVLRDALKLTIAGIAAGLVITLAAAVPILKTLPLTVRQPNVATIVIVAIATAIVAFTGCLIPARRAGLADPLAMLRSE